MGLESRNQLQINCHCCPLSLSLVRCGGDDDYYGFNDETAVPDLTEAELAVRTIAALFSPG
jgi:hypothetical protein